MAKPLAITVVLDTLAHEQDWSELSGLAYINPTPTGGINVFDDINIQPSFGVGGHSGIAFDAMRDAVAGAVIAKIGTKTSSNLNDRILIETFHAGCRAAYMLLLRNRLTSLGRIVPADESKDTNLVAAGNAMDLIRDGVTGLLGDSAEVLRIQAALIKSGINVWTFDNVVDQFASRAAADMEKGSSKIVDAYAYAAILTMCRPVFKLAALSLVASGEMFEFVARAYARRALTLAASTALTVLSRMYSDASNTTAVGLRAASTTVAGMFVSQLDMSDVVKDVDKVLSKGDKSRDMSSTLASDGKTLQDRTIRTADMQAVFNADARDVTRARWLMLTWLVALVTVIATSSLLIAKDQLTLFAVLAVLALFLTLVDRAVRLAAWSWRHRSAT